MRKQIHACRAINGDTLLDNDEKILKVTQGSNRVIIRTMTNEHIYLKMEMIMVERNYG